MTLLVTAVLPAPGAAVEVEGDDAAEAFVGRGGLILPPQIDEITRTRVAECPDCVWRLASPCAQAPLGNAFDPSPPCLSVTRGCPGGTLRRTWFREGTAPWQEIGLVCLREDPVTVRAIGARVEERLLHHLPPLEVGHLPRQGIVTGLPTVFATGQPSGRQAFRWRLEGLEVEVEVTPSWEWTFPGGGRGPVSYPGVLAPMGPIREVFRRPGLARVTCSATWTGQYRVGGLGPFPISSPVVQEATTRVAVGEGRALLTP
jgi:hypothetical protein